MEAELSVARLLEGQERERAPEMFPASLCACSGPTPECGFLPWGPGPEGPGGEVFAALLEMVRLWPVDEDVLEHLVLLDYSPDRRRKMAEALAARAGVLPERAALAFLRWISLLPDRGDILGKILSHQSARVLAAALSLWPGGVLPDDLALIRLLKRDEDGILVPLLRILKSRGAPPWAAPRLAALSEKHPSAAVRVWARSIVRAENLV